MDRRAFLKGVAASMALVALPEIVSAATTRWSPDRLVSLHAVGVATESKFSTVVLRRGPNNIFEQSLNAMHGMFQYVPLPGMEPVGSDLEIVADDDVMAAAVFRRPDGTAYVRTAGAAQ